MTYNGIFWIKDWLIDSFSHENHFYCAGEDSKGNIFEGCWIEIDGEFEEITNIELQRF